jgi:hypothetical protein
VDLDTETSITAGSYGAYIVSFTATVDIPAFSTIQVIFPPEIDLSLVGSTDCTSVPVEEFELEGALTCILVEPKIVDIVGFEIDIPSG